MGVVRTTAVKYDSALGIVLSVFFGFGLVLLTFIQRRPDATQAGLDNFLFGQAATPPPARPRSRWPSLGAVALGADAARLEGVQAARLRPRLRRRASGYPMRALDVLLTALLVVAIVIGLQTVGVVLMARWSSPRPRRRGSGPTGSGSVALLAGAVRALAGVIGAVSQPQAERLPTGPTIVLCVSAIVLVSLALRPAARPALAPARGRVATGGCSASHAVLADLHDARAPARAASSTATPRRCSR